MKKLIKELCKTYTNLSAEDIEKLENIEKTLPVIADLVKADIFIDCLTRDPNIAIVVSEAKPTTCQSMYKNSVVGQLALRQNEPAALRTLQIGVDTIDLKAITQENSIVRQNVVPIKNESKRVIGVLIMENDITKDVNQSTHVEILSETTEQLTETLMNLIDAENENVITNHMNDAIVVFDGNAFATYANRSAYELYDKLGYKDKIVGMKFDNLVLNETSFDEIIHGKEYSIFETDVGKLSLQVKYAATKKDEKVIGIIMLIKDITEVKEKEKELILKSVAIREIHHRVKNNLQTIASLLRLQSRRMDDIHVQKLFNESINRILSIAVTHEVLAKRGVDDVDIKTILSKIIDNVISFGVELNKKILISLSGDSINVDSDKATSIAMVVNELLQNSLEHAFSEKDKGNIKIIIQKGIMYSSITIIDDGSGFDVGLSRKESLGLNIVKRIISDKLNGHFNIESDENGTKIVFDFEN